MLCADRCRLLRGEMLPEEAVLCMELYEGPPMELRGREPAVEVGAGMSR